MSRDPYVYVPTGDPKKFDWERARILAEKFNETGATSDIRRLLEAAVDARSIQGVGDVLLDDYCWDISERSGLGEEYDSLLDMYQAVEENLLQDDFTKAVEGMSADMEMHV